MKDRVYVADGWGLYECKRCRKALDKDEPHTRKECNYFKFYTGTAIMHNN